MTKYGNYETDIKLGSGAFSTVWRSAAFAIKVYDDSDLKYFKNELRMLAHVGAHDNIVTKNDAFVALQANSAVEIYPCIVFPLMGDHIGRLLRRLYSDEMDGLTMPQIAHFATQILRGIEHIHSRGVIHGDIKPENILMEVHAGDVDMGGSSTSIGDAAQAHANSIGSLRLKICDFGSAQLAQSANSTSVGTAGYIAPELIIGAKFNTSVDIWSAFCVFYELYTTTMLFDIYNEAKLNYGEDVQNDLNLMSKNSRDEYQLSYVYLLLIEKLLGPAPKELTSCGRIYYNARGKLKNNPHVEHVGIIEHLKRNYTLDETAEEFHQFLQLGLQYLPAQRATAAQALAAINRA